ncbi:polysaccharide export protein EpsE [Craterilacuibacter sp.]|uniref:polysaccharide export protein EpsE n=1 Tax=Craterilacuibacter sp. TaxID=2870909 RepID=UPI003F34ADED
MKALLVRKLKQALACTLLLGTVNAWASPSDYQLGAGDAIRVQVFQNPDLMLETRVGEGGSISYPLIGQVRVGGLSLANAETVIAKALKKGGFVEQPQVNIALMQVRGNQVSVLGQVNRPGRFPLETSNTRLSDLLALAGGTTPTGADMVVVSGNRDGKPFRKEIDVPALYLAQQANGEDDILMQGGDVLYVHKAPMYYIYGEAQRPGAYRIERGMTIKQALAQGGGPTVRGTEMWLSVERKGADGKFSKQQLDMADSVRSDDVIYVRESLF